jgi:glycosyltransferase involved in cell wall biosynthesis
LNYGQGKLSQIEKNENRMIIPNSEFNTNLYPGKPKILFIGLAESSHTHSWINLLANSEFNVRLFAMPTVLPPESWKVQTYITTPNLVKGMDPSLRKCLFPLPENLEEWERKCKEVEKEKEDWAKVRQEILKYSPLFLFFRLIRKAFFSLRKLIKYPFVYKEVGIELPPKIAEHISLETNLPKPQADSPEEWLSIIIQEWKPDIIHTLGMYDFQGGEFYFLVRKKYQLENIGKWILQLRGGSDLSLRQYDPEIAPRMAEMMRECDQILSDNYMNIQYAERLGITRNKFASIVPVPGTGGIDIDSFAKSRDNSPSKRRMILWPKSYECMWSKAIPVFESIKIAWKDIQPCEIYILAANPETRSIYFALPEEIRLHCHLFEKLDRGEVFKLNGLARVSIMPSLVDGVPNSLFEAMAAGAFPIVSPLDTMTSVVENEYNVLFARNLYPEEIASALVRAMNDDTLVENAAVNNVEKVRSLADRNLIQKKVIKFYASLIEK